MPSLFLSHASDDSELVDQFVQCIFRLGSNLNPDQFFYSSGADSRVPIGQPGNPYIRDRAREAELVICVVTPAYAASHYCIAELGAAWASAHEGALFPLILPTMRHSDLEGVLQGVEIRSLDDRAALNELHQRLGEATDITSSTTTWEKGREQWLESLPGLMDVSSDVKPSLSRGDTQSDSWGRLYDTLVDAALYKESEQTARNAILQHIETDTVISSRFHYSHDACAANWISRCKDPQYQHQRHTTEFWSGAASKKYVAQVRDLVAGQLFDFVSLGPGDGRRTPTWSPTGLTMASTSSTTPTTSASRWLPMPCVLSSVEPMRGDLRTGYASKRCWRTSSTSIRFDRSSNIARRRTSSGSLER